MNISRIKLCFSYDTCSDDECQTHSTRGAHGRMGLFRPFRLPFHANELNGGWFGSALVRAWACPCNKLDFLELLTIAAGSPYAGKRNWMLHNEMKRIGPRKEDAYKTAILFALQKIVWLRFKRFNCRHTFENNIGNTRIACSRERRPAESVGRCKLYNSPVGEWLDMNILFERTFHSNRIFPFEWLANMLAANVTVLVSIRLHGPHTANQFYCTPFLVTHTRTTKATFICTQWGRSARWKCHKYQLIEILFQLHVRFWMERFWEETTRMYCKLSGWNLCRQSVRQLRAI